MSKDPRLHVFLHDPTEVFDSIEHRHEIWRDDPFDVTSVHKEAREQFEMLLARATTPLLPDGKNIAPSGRILLLLGPSGAGKTHLLRMFRSHVHKTRAGFMAYMQLISESRNYARYVLSYLVDSLDQPYDETLDSQTGLARLATALASRAFEPKLASMLRDDPDLTDEQVIDLVCRGADRLIVQYRSRDFVDLLDLIRALLYLHRSDPRLKARILKFLRCEDLNEHDRKLIGGLAPRTGEEDPEHMIKMLGRLMGEIADTPYSLVVCLDQLEGMFHREATEVPLKKALITICDLAGLVPSSIFVVSCLEDAYAGLKARLPRPVIDRLENIPPIRLKDERTPEEARDLVATRLRYLYANAGAPFDESTPLYPFPGQFLEQQTDPRTRPLIDACRRYRQRCQRAGQILPITAEPPPESGHSEEYRREVEQWERKWNTFLADHEDSPPEEETTLSELLAWALTSAGEELETEHRFPARVANGAVLAVAHVKGRPVEHIYVALCNRTAQFGWLARQMAQHIKLAKAHPQKPVLVLVRSDEFPKAPLVQKELVAALKAGGRTVVIQDADWRAVLGLKAFRKRYESERWFKEWLAEENHISRLLPIRHILDLDHLDRFPATSTAQEPGKTTVETTPTPDPPPTATDVAPVKAPPTGDTMAVGVTKGLISQPVELTRQELTCHAAFLGGSGSGKTTLALGVIEQLLLQGIPVLMLDRKGDLAGYARPEVWARPLPDPVLSARRDALKARVDVNLFTPGHPEGRPVAISVAPEGLSEMPAFERVEAAEHAAHALGDMLGYKHISRDASLRAILIQALQVLAENGTRAITLDALAELIGEADQALLSRVSRLDPKLFNKLVQDLETLKLTSTHLFAASGEPLDVDALLGTGPHARTGRTRLTIISTKFLRDDAQIQFWVAQLLAAVLRWASKNPRNTLQAALLFDEADLYLPAMRQPATKLPMENLLKRGRSAGLSILLATQSPGDLDYRCRDNIRTWFLGRIKEQTALLKLKPMLIDSPVDVTERLPGQGTGEFHVVREGKVTPIKAYRSVLGTEQIADSELLVLARRARPTAAHR
jgi:energy-coupling factor transporter ATP-binding protein EcfA2